MILPNWIAAPWAWIKSAKAAIFTGAVAVAVCLPLGYCKGHNAAEADCVAAQALANVKAQQIDAGAKDIAAEERVRDALSVSTKEEELIDAIKQEPDTTPGAVRVRLGCERLRRQGGDPAALPAVCGPTG